MVLSRVQQRFILHWGEMGTRWGVNRTMAQIHALLYVTGESMHAEAITDTLQVARSNVSTCVRELQGWGVIRVVHVLGDRRDHFESLSDVWEMFQVVLDQRKRREIDPTIRVLRECLDDLGKGRKRDVYTEERLRQMLDFFEKSSAVYAELRKMPQGLLKFVRLGGKMRRLLGAS